MRKSVESWSPPALHVATAADTPSPAERIRAANAMLAAAASDQLDAFEASIAETLRLAAEIAAADGVHAPGPRACATRIAQLVTVEANALAAIRGRG